MDLHLLAGTGSALLDAQFSPSFNLRLFCESEAVLRALQKPLSKFRAEPLAAARSAQLSKTAKKTGENSILSVPADQVVPMLIHYCKVYTFELDTLFWIF